MTFDVINVAIIVVVLFTALVFAVLGAAGNYDPERDPPPPTFAAAVKRIATESIYLALMFVAIDLALHRDQFWERQPATIAIVLGAGLLRVAIDWVIRRRRLARKGAA